MILRTTTNHFIACLFVLLSLSSEAQSFLNQNSEIEKGNYQLSEIIDFLIEKRGLNISYRDDLIKPNQSIDVEGDETIEVLLKKITKKFALLSYKVSSGAVILYENIEVGKRRKFTVFGTVIDGESGESLSGANVFILKNDSLATPIASAISNNFGFYSITLPEGKYGISPRFLGFAVKDTVIDVTKSRRHDLVLAPEINKLGAVLIETDDAIRAIAYTPPGVVKIDLNTNQDAPYFLGEKDVLQKAMLLPGIRNISEDAIGVNVRGGNIDENRILMDNATIYNSSHFYGLVSVFNPDALKGVTLYKSGIHPKYGGRTSSVFVVDQKEGSTKRFKGEGSLGTTFSRLMVQGPVSKLGSSFLLSGRGSFPNISYFDLLSSLDNASFLDFNGKWNTVLNERNRVYFSFYRGRDVVRDVLGSDRQWGNLNYTTRWNHVFNEKLFANFSFISSNYNYSSVSETEVDTSQYKSSIKDLDFLSDFSYFLSPNAQIDFGFQSTFHTFDPGISGFADTLAFTPVEFDTLEQERSIESAIYLNTEFKHNKNLTVRIGARFSNFTKTGKSQVFSYRPGETRSVNSIIDTTFFDRGDRIVSFLGFEPRLSLNYRLNDVSVIKAAYDRHRKYIHLISNSLNAVPTDTWKMSDPHIKPSTSNNFTLGYYRVFERFNIKSNVELFYRSTSNVIDYKNGAQLFLNDNIETVILQGRGRSYGMEILLKRDLGEKVSGWISYTLSESLRRYDGQFRGEKINGGEFFPSNHDRLHDLTLTGFYKVNNRLSFSLNFILASGAPATLPSGKLVIDGVVVPAFSGRNQQRLPLVHRLDLGAKWLPNKERHSFPWNGTWSLSIYNAYSRRNVNAYFLSFDNESKETFINEFTIFDTFLPSLTYSYKF